MNGWPENETKFFKRDKRHGLVWIKWYPCMDTCIHVSMYGFNFHRYCKASGTGSVLINDKEIIVIDSCEEPEVKIVLAQLNSLKLNVVHFREFQRIYRDVHYRENGMNGIQPFHFIP